MMLEPFLQLWDREGIVLWPRKAMGLFSHGQVLVKSREEFEEVIEESGGLDCFMQSHTEWDRSNGILYIIFIDIDFPGDLDRAKKVKDRVQLHISREYEVKPYIQFSGLKGYHILVPVKVTKLPPAKYPEFLKFCQLKLSLGYCDRQLLGDIVRLVRIAGTFNSKAVERGMDGQVQMVQEWDGRELDLSLLWELFKLQKLSEKRRKKTGVLKFAAKQGAKIRPSVQALVERCTRGQSLSHKERLIILFEMINAGYSDQQIHEVFKNQPDYSEKTTQYFIDHARRRGYRPFTTQKVLEVLNSG